MSYYDAEAGAELKATFEAAVLDWADAEATTTFGCPTYRADGTVFAVLVTDGVALTRLPHDARDRLAGEFETGPFEAGGRTVTKWVLVTLDDAEEFDELLPCVRESYETALEES